MAEPSGSSEDVVELRTLSVRVERRAWRDRLTSIAFGLAMMPLVYALLVTSFVAWERPEWFYTAAWTSWGLAITAALATAMRSVGFVTSGPGDVRLGDAGFAWRAGGASDWREIGSPAAWAEARTDGVVRLHLEDGRQIEIHLHQPEQNERLMQQANHTGRRLVTRMRAAGRGARLALTAIATHVFVLQLAGKLRVMSQLQALFTLSLCLVVIALVHTRSRPPRLEVGADGIAIERHRYRRFISYDTIAETRLDVTTLTLQLKGDDLDEVVEVSRDNIAELQAVYERLEAARAAYAQSPDAPPRLALLDRQGRSMADWRAAVAKQITAEDFRRATLSADDVEAIFAAPNATPEHRIGAAMALRIAGGQDARERIRVAAEHSANDELRQALLEVAESDAYSEVPRERIALNR